MGKVKVTVIKKFSSKDVFGKDYKNPKGEIIPVCSIFKEGQVLISEDGDKPEGFCGFGWRAIQAEAMVLAFGGNFWESWTERFFHFLNNENSYIGLYPPRFRQLKEKKWIEEQ
ncbi:MAG: hypothetical protein ACTSSK_17705 [Candidatus Heimdallarchaeota archaeon]